MSTILIVDDDARFRRTLRIALGAWGHEILEAPNGIEALQSISRRLPDIVLLDWRMPGMGGLETCKAIHKDSHIPVFVVSSDSSLTAAEVENAGAIGLLAKPFSISDLVSRISAALRP